MNYIFGYAYNDGLVVLAEGLDMFRLGPVATGGEDEPVRQFLLYERNFG
jgi:hypothetical protein